MLVSYPNFSKDFKNSRRLQQNIYQENNQWLIGYHFLLLTQVNPHLINYTFTVRKLFSIVGTLKGK